MSARRRSRQTTRTGRVFIERQRVDPLAIDDDPGGDEVVEHAPRALEQFGARGDIVLQLRARGRQQERLPRGNVARDALVLAAERRGHETHPARLIHASQLVTQPDSQQW